MKSQWKLVGRQIGVEVREEAARSAHGPTSAPRGAVRTNSVVPDSMLSLGNLAPCELTRTPSLYWLRSSIAGHTCFKRDEAGPVKALVFLDSKDKAIRRGRSPASLRRHT